MNQLNFYDILEISNNASPSDIKKSYRRLSMKYHPDKNASSDTTQQMSNINCAYQTLSEPSKRTEYDHQLKYGITDQDISSDEFSDINNIFSNLFKDVFNMKQSQSQDLNSQSSFGLFMPGMMPPGMMPPGMMPPGMIPPGMIPPGLIPPGMMPPGMTMPSMSNIADLLNGTSNNPFQECITPEPIIIDHDISLIDAYNGAHNSITFERWIIVNTRRVSEKKIIYFDIPPGVNDNEVIIIEKQGNQIDKHNIGSLEIIISIHNDTEFIRDGNDIIYNKNISFKESLCGFSFKLEHIGGKSFAFNNNNDESCSLIYHGFKRIVPNYGFKRGDNIGNLIIIFSVNYPNSLSSDQIISIREII